MNNSFFSKIIFIFICHICFSCGGDIDQITMNRKFEVKYRSEVDRILKQKNIKKRNFAISNSSDNFVKDPNRKLFMQPVEIFKKQTQLNRSSKFDTNKLFLKQPEDFLPNMNVFLEGSKNFRTNKIPADIFDIKYNTNNHPPFQVTGIDFDLIVVPKKDAHGISSSLEDKVYPIPSRKHVKEVVNKMIRQRSDEDIEFTQNLIAENKLIRKQLMVSGLFQKDIESQSLNNKDNFLYDNTEEQWAKNRIESRSHDLYKLIGNQVIIKNLESGMSRKASEVKNNAGNFFNKKSNGNSNENSANGQNRNANTNNRR